MSDEKENGGPAFPVADLEGAGITPSALSIGGHPAWAGMNLRDYFAAKALQGFLAEAANPRFGVTQEPPNAVHWTAFAQDAYFLADAMLAERNRTHE